jgi:hypothetical protein
LKNTPKKQNTLSYPYKFKVVEVCLVGAGDGLQTLHASHAIKTYILTQKTPKIRRFCVIFYALPNRLLHFYFVLASAWFCDLKGYK